MQQPTRMPENIVRVDLPSHIRHSMLRNKRPPQPAPEHVVRVDPPGHIRHEACVRVICAQALHVLSQDQSAIGSMELQSKGGKWGELGAFPCEGWGNSQRGGDYASIPRCA